MPAIVHASHRACQPPCREALCYLLRGIAAPHASPHGRPLSTSPILELATRRHHHHEGAGHRDAVPGPESHGGRAAGACNSLFCTDISARAFLYLLLYPVPALQHAARWTPCQAPPQASGNVGMTASHRWWLLGVVGRHKTSPSVSCRT